MNLPPLNNPQNLWGKWVKLSPKKQNILLIFLVLCSIYYPSHKYINLLQSQFSLEITLQQRQENLIHQQQILRTLKKVSDNTLLTPELIRYLLPINQNIQSLAKDLHITDSHWFFKYPTRLTLQLQGHFRLFSQFLTALLHQTSELALIHLQINKLENNTDFSIQIEISFQLQTFEDKP